MTDYILAAVLAAVLGGAALYILRQKRKGNKCIGCPYSNSCSGHCGDRSEE